MNKGLLSAYEREREPRVPLPGVHIFEQVQKLALLGLGDQQLADLYTGGDLEAFNEWRFRYQQLDEAIQRGRLLADAEVAAALHKRAVGYELEDTRKSYVPDKDAPGGQRLVREDTRVVHVPASVEAMELWLKTRQREHWPAKPLPIEPDESNIPGKPEANANNVGQELIRRVEAVLTRAADQVRESVSRVDTEPASDPEGPVD